MVEDNSQKNVNTGVKTPMITCLIKLLGTILEEKFIDKNCFCVRNDICNFFFLFLNLYQSCNQGEFSSH